MRKTLLLTALLMATSGLAMAQNAVELDSHCFGWYLQYMENVLEMRDGSILTNSRLFKLDEQGHPTTDLGFCLLKLNRKDLSVMDSVIIRDDYATRGTIERNPSGDGYLFVNLDYDPDTQQTSFKILHFDDNLSLGQMVETPIADSFRAGSNYFLDGDCLIVDSRDTLGNMYYLRFGLDGSLLDRKVAPSGGHNPWLSGGYRLWNDSPRQYVFTGYSPSPQPMCAFFVLDSLLNIQDTIPMGAPPYNCQFSYKDTNKVERYDDSTYLMACESVKTSGNDAGIQVYKRRIGTHAVVGSAYFPSEQQSWIAHGMYVIDLRRLDNGNVYLAYGDLTGQNRVTVAMLDPNLDIVWVRSYLGLQAYRYATDTQLLEDGGMAIVGFFHNQPLVFALVVSDDYDALEEQGLVVRPYTFWPNPAQGELRLQYSPDVKPTRIELYDLQGRLARSQRTSLESLSLEGLPAGTYTLSVSLEDGKTFADKVVKE